MLFLLNKVTVTIIVCVAVVLALLVLVFILLALKKDRGQKIDDEFMKVMIDSLGGIENIKDYSVENARVKFELSNLDIAKLDKLKELSPKGVFVTNNSVKTLFKYESKDIVKNLEKIKK